MILSDKFSLICIRNLHSNGLSTPRDMFIISIPSCSVGKGSGSGETEGRLLTRTAKELGCQVNLELIISK